MLNMVNLVSFKTSIDHIIVQVEIIHHYIRDQVVKGIVKVNYFNYILKNVLRFINPIL